MATANKRADKQKEREKREKILLAVLVVILIIVGAIMLPGMLKKKGNLDQVAAQPAVPSATTTTSTGATPASGTPSAGAPAVTGTVAGASFASTPGYRAEEGQLSKFGLFASKDPFGGVPGSGAASATTSSTPTATTKTTKTTKTTTPSAAYAAALIAVNGGAEVVNLGASFPATSPMFNLNSITAESITISVADGSFSDGRSTVKIQKGHTLVLVNTADGTRYAIKLIKSLKSGEVVPGITTSSTTMATETAEPQDTNTSTSSTASTTTTTTSTTTTTGSTTTTTTTGP